MVNDSLVITALIILGVRDNCPQNYIGIKELNGSCERAYIPRHCTWMEKTPLRTRDVYEARGTMTQWKAALFLVADSVATLRESIVSTERHIPSLFVSCNAQSEQKGNSPQEKQARASPAGGGGPPVEAGVGGGGVTLSVKGRG